MGSKLGEQVHAFRADFNKAHEAAMVSGTSEDLERVTKMDLDLSALEARYNQEIANQQKYEDRKAAEEAEKKQAEEDSKVITTVPYGSGNGSTNGTKDGGSFDTTAMKSEAFHKWLASLQPKMASDRFLESDIYKQHAKKGHYQGVHYTIEVPGTVKAAGDPITSASFGPRITDQTVMPHYAAMPTVYDLFRIVPVSGAGSVRYYQATMPLANNAAFIAEGALKPEVQPRWAQVDAPIETIAEWTAVTLQALDDVPQLRAVLEDDLRRLLLLKIDEKLLAGSGTPPEIRGILNTVGIQTQGFTTDMLTTLANAVTKVVSGGAGYPTAIVMNPADWQSVRLLSTGGIYFFGSPAEQGVMRIWGIPVVPSVNQAAGFAIVGDFNYGTIFERWGVTFIVGLKNDDLIKNLQTIVCEARLALAIRRPAAFVNADIVTP